MSHEADREVWLNFLDEVDEYLNTIESGLLGIAETGVDHQRMDAALRSVHTIKGIGSMIECPSMSQLAHQFEDSLKIIKVRGGAVQLDATLEMLLLQGLDSIRRISELHRQASPITESWLSTHAYPSFEELHERLGDVQPGDELALLAEESEDNTAVVMFGTEVDELLERLQSVLDIPGSPCLREELEMKVEELHALGQMLQLDAFSRLCESIAQQLLVASPEQVEPLARQSLDIWQRSQALVMVGQHDKLPDRLEIGAETTENAPFGSGDDAPALEEMDTSLAFVEAEREAEPEPGLDISELETLDLVNVAEPEVFAFEPADWEDADTLVGYGPEDAVPSGFVEAETAEPQTQEPGAADVEYTAVENEPDAIAPTDQPLDEIDLASIEAALESFNPTEFQFYSPPATSDPYIFPDEPDEHVVADEDIVLEPEPQSEFVSFFQNSKESEEFEELLVEPVEAANSSSQNLPENTVRVPIKLLTQLNDLFGELIIQRNTMNSRLDQMEDLMQLFSQRMVSLDVTNTELQTFCDQLAVDTSAPDFKTDNSTPSYGTAAAIFSESATDQAFDSLELDRYSDLHLLSQDQRETLVQLREVTSDVKLNMREIKQASSNLNRTAKALQINVTRARMRPLSDLVERFPRTVRELSLQYGKTVELKISGGSTLIDRFVAVHLRDPLMHLLRNAFDHGIEDTETRQAQGKPPQGTIEIRAAHRGSQTLISISDDGAGINLTKIRSRAYQMGLTDDILDSMSQSDLLGMIFEPGFSTASQVTSLSGRGIGMDVVRTSLEQIRSEVKVDTQPGIGTTFTISVPFTLSIMRVLLVESGGMRLAFPTDSVEEMLRLSAVQIFDSPKQKVINWEGLTVPLIHLDQWLNFHCPRQSHVTEATPVINEPSILIVNRGDRLNGVYIDRFWGEREVVIRQVENVISLPQGFNGCTILEDGYVVPLADVSKLLDWIDHDDREEVTSHNWSNRWQHLLQSPPEEEPPRQLALPQAQQTNILVVEDSNNMRQLLSTTLEKADYRVEQGKDGQDAIDQLSSGLAVDAVVCDIEMPRLDGYGVLAEIKADARLKDLPVIMLTSRGSDKHRQLATRLGAAAYITKPYQDHELLQAIEQVLQPQPLTTVQ